MARSCWLVQLIVYEINLTVRAVIGAALVAAVAVNTFPRDLPRMREALPDKARKVLQRRRPKRLDLVEQLVVEHFLDLRHPTLQQPQIQHHPGRGIGRAAHRYLCTEGVAVDFLACRTQSRSRQRMRCLEPERFCQLPHFKHSKFYLIPIVLFVCRLIRPFGLRSQYCIARAVFSTMSGPSIGCSENRSKSRSTKASGAASACG